MKDNDERVKVTELFLLVGEKAIASTASSYVLNLFQTGIEILDTDSWITRYSFCYNLYCNAVKSACSIEDYKRMDNFN